MANPLIFFNTLLEFMHNLVVRFPDNKGCQTAYSSLRMFGSSTSLHPQMMQAWVEATNPIKSDIKERNTEAVCKCLDGNANPIIAGIGASKILLNADVDEETKESVWKYLQTLTSMANQEGEVVPEAPAVVAAPVVKPVPMAAPGQTVGTATAAGATGKKAAGPDVGKIVDGFTQAMPKVMDSINDMLKSKEGENPLADMIKQMMNPNQLQTGMAGNVMANMMENTDQSVMQEAALKSGLSVDDIMYRLNRLENLEKSRNLRKQMKGKRQ
jgi:hypothetical protein